MKRLTLIALVLVSLGIASPRTVGASDEWCDVDPVMVIHTPGGALVPVFVNTGAQGALYSPQVLLADLTYTYSAKAAKGGTATDVDVTVIVPKGFVLTASRVATRAVVSTGPIGTGNIYGRAQGVSGQAMHVMFQLPVA